MRDKHYDKQILQNFFQHSIGFFVQNVPLREETFKKGFHKAHSDWIDLKRGDIETYPIKSSLITSITELFEKAETYFYLVIGSGSSYSNFDRQDKWSELQTLAKKIQNDFFTN